jgi:hypothetical protein
MWDECLIMLNDNLIIFPPPFYGNFRVFWIHAEEKLSNITIIDEGVK